MKVLSIQENPTMSSAGRPRRRWVFALIFNEQFCLNLNFGSRFSGSKILNETKSVYSRGDFHSLGSHIFRVEWLTFRSLFISLYHCLKPESKATSWANLLFKNFSPSLCFILERCLGFPFCRILWQKLSAMKINSRSWKWQSPRSVTWNWQNN